jgi:hypothetical protein
MEPAERILDSGRISSRVSNLVRKFRMPQVRPGGASHVGGANYVRMHGDTSVRSPRIN